MTDIYADINNYEFKKTLGEGNFAKVKLSIFKPTNEEFAIKIINKNKLKHKMKNTIFRETEIISKLKHPNIITVFKMVEDLENYYIIMENCKRGELFDYIVEHQNLDENEASIFFYQLINGVEYIHSQNIVHRDLKPENLLLTEKKILKIIDFGLSHPFDGTVYLKTKCGSPSYAAPEIINCKEYDGFKTDVWCCGVILYAMLCGFLPFEGENDTELFKSIVECDPEIPRELSKESRKLIRKIFTPNPKKRITISEIKKTDFYFKGKKLYNIKNDNIINDIQPHQNIDFIKNFGHKLLKVEGEDNKNIKSNNNKNNDNNIITIDEENNNYEAITIASNDDDYIDNEMSNNNKKSNNIHIYDIKKINKIKALQTININHDNNNRDREYKNNIEIEDKENNNHLQTYGNVERTQMPRMKLQLNFNNNLRINYNNNNIFNSFRKKLINEELNNKLKQKFENYQKIMKTEGNELKNDNNIMQPFNQKQEQLSPINFNHINNISMNSNKTLNNQTNQQVQMPTIKDNILSNNKGSKKNLTLKIADSNSNKNVLSLNHRSKKLILGKTPHRFKNVLNNINIKANEQTSFKRFCDNLLNNNRISMKSFSSKRKTFNISNNNNNKNRTHNDENQLNTINITKTSKNINSKSIEVKNINSNSPLINNSLVVKNKHFASPWKNFGPKIIRKGKFSPSINSLKNSIVKNNLIHSTPKRNLYYNNINNNINTINVNENRNNKIVDNKLYNQYSDRRKEEKEENKNYMNINTNTNSNSYKKSPIDKKNNNIKINFTKIIAEVKNKNTIYHFDKINNYGNVGKSLGPHHKKKDGDLYLLKTNNMQRNFGNNNLSKHYIVRKGNPKSEDKRKQRENYKNIPILNNNNYFKIHNLITSPK